MRTNYILTILIFIFNTNTFFQNVPSYENDPWLWDLDWSKPKKPANVSCLVSVPLTCVRLFRSQKLLKPSPNCLSNYLFKLAFFFSINS